MRDQLFGNAFVKWDPNTLYRNLALIERYCQQVKRMFMIVGHVSVTPNYVMVQRIFHHSLK